MLRVRLLLASRLGPERLAHTRLLRRRMTSPIRYAHPNILNKAVASHVLSTHQSTHFVQKRHENNHLVRFKSGKVWLSGVVADTQAKADHTLATKLGVDPTWVGTYVGRRYYRTHLSYLISRRQRRPACALLPSHVQGGLSIADACTSFVLARICTRCPLVLLEQGSVSSICA